jgi:SlyX protein
MTCAGRPARHWGIEAMPNTDDMHDMHDMRDVEQLARRVKELEIKTGFAEDLLEQLNEVVHRQQLQIERLAQQLGQLRQQLAEADADKGAFRSLRDELPPHY